MKYLLFLPLLLCAGCVSDAQRQDVANNSQAQIAAAQSLPASPQTADIVALALANAQLVGLPIATPTVTPVPAPATVAPVVSP